MTDPTNIQKLSKHITDTYARVGVTVIQERPEKLLVYENQPTGSLLYLHVMSELIKIYGLQWWVTYDTVKKQCVLIVTTY